MTHFLPNKGNYRSLIVYKLSECIYDIAFYFTHHFLEKGDRTVDQMVQAARSCKQNIVEGSAAATTSAETELKLMNVARASLQELLQDYEDYLRVRGLERWLPDDERCVQTRRVIARHDDSAFYREQIASRSDVAIANIAITMIHQEDVMLRRYIDYLKRSFLEHGGIREQMSQARREYRDKQRNND